MAIGEVVFLMMLGVLLYVAVSPLRFLYHLWEAYFSYPRSSERYGKALLDRKLAELAVRCPFCEMPVDPKIRKCHSCGGHQSARPKRQAVWQAATLAGLLTLALAKTVPTEEFVKGFGEGGLNALASFLIGATLLQVAMSLFAVLFTGFFVFFWLLEKITGRRVWYRSEEWVRNQQ
jgi:hypothetical protein